MFRVSFSVCTSEKKKKLFCQLNLFSWDFFFFSRVELWNPTREKNDCRYIHYSIYWIRKQRFIFVFNLLFLPRACRVSNYNFESSHKIKLFSQYNISANSTTSRSSITPLYDDFWRLCSVREEKYDACAHRWWFTLRPVRHYWPCQVRIRVANSTITEYRLFFAFVAWTAIMRWRRLYRVYEYSRRSNKAKAWNKPVIIIVIIIRSLAYVIY